MKKTILGVLLATSIILLGYCHESIGAEEKEAVLKQVKKGNFVLYVSNQSFDIDFVDIKVYIDGLVAVNQEFTVGQQKNWIPFQFQLSEGTHKLKIQSVKGDSKLEQKFKITGNNWAKIKFLYASEGADPVSKQFTFAIKDKEIQLK